MKPGIHRANGRPRRDTQNTGLFCLLPNDGFGEHLPYTTLSKT